MAAGDVVNTASRLAAGGARGRRSSSASRRTAPRATRSSTARPSRSLAKGKAEPVPVWEALGDAGAVRRRRRSSAARAARRPRRGARPPARGAAPRAPRARRRSSSRSSACPGSARAGSSPSSRRPSTSDPELVFWRQGRSLPYGDGVTFWALGEMAKAQAGILALRRRRRGRRRSSRDAVAALIPDEGEARWVESHLRPLVGLDARATAGDRPRARRSPPGAASSRRWRSARPLVLVFEDLHWADEALLDFVDELVDRAVGVPLLVVATARPELLRAAARAGAAASATRRRSRSRRSRTTDTAQLLGALLERAVLPAEAQAELLARRRRRAAVRRGVRADARGPRPAARRRSVCSTRAAAAGDGAGDHRRAPRRAARPTRRRSCRTRR